MNEIALLPNDRKLVGAFNSYRGANKEMRLRREVDNYLLAAEKNKDLLKCELSSIKACLLDCATMGLTISPNAGLAYAIPYWLKAGSDFVLHVSLCPSYRGYRHAVLSTGVAKSIDTQKVHENDVFDWWMDDQGAHYTFKPMRKNRGPLEQVFCYATFANGQTHMEVMDHEDIRACMDAAVKKNNKKQMPTSEEEYNRLLPSPWKTFTGQMWRKSCERRAQNRWPRLDEANSSRLDKITEVMNRQEGYIYDERGSDTIEGEATELLSPTDVNDLLKLMAEDVPSDHHQHWLGQCALAMGFTKGIASVPRDQKEVISKKITDRIQALKDKHSAEEPSDA